MYRIMVIEDDTAMAGTIKKQIEAWGNTVMCISDFQNVISAFIQFDPHMGIFAFVFRLYDLKTEAVCYAAGLCVLLMMPVLSVHYFSYRKRHLERQRILKQIEIIDEKMIAEKITDGQLPEPETLAEADAWKMIRRLKQICDKRQTDWQQERQEHMDYYTTWVHQIKTPISVMRMTLQAEDTEEYRELLVQLFRIEQYTEMVLSYLRLGSHCSDFVFQEYKLDDIIRQAVHKYASLFVRKRIRLQYKPSGQIVLTDEKWLLFIIEQILSNAIKQYFPTTHFQHIIISSRFLFFPKSNLTVFSCRPHQISLFSPAVHVKCPEQFPLCTDYWQKQYKHLNSNHNPACYPHIRVSFSIHWHHHQK